MAGFYRNLFGGVFLLAIAIWRGEKLWAGWKPFALAVVCGMLFATDLSLWHRSIHYIGPGLSTIMGNFQVFFLAAFGILVARERVGWRVLVSIPLAVVGLLMLVGADWNRLAGDYRLGVWFGGGTAVMYAAYLVTLRYAQGRKDRLPAAANLCIISLLTAGIMALEGIAQGEAFHVPNARSWASMVTYGVVCQAVGWIIISRALVKVPASRAGLILLGAPAQDIK